MEYVIVVDSPISSNQKDHDQTSSRKLYEDYQVYDSTFISSSSERGDKFVFDEKSQVRSLLVDVDFRFMLLDVLARMDIWIEIEGYMAVSMPRN